MNSINFRTKEREKRAAWYTSVRSSTIKLWIHGNKVAKLFYTLNLLLFWRSRCRRRRRFVRSLDDYYFLLLKVRYKLDRISIVHDRALTVNKSAIPTCITLFCTFLCSPCTTTTWNDQILSLFGNGNGKAINSTTCVWTRPRSLLSSSNPNSPLLSNCTLRIIVKKSERMRSLYFSDVFMDVNVVGS